MLRRSIAILQSDKHQLVFFSKKKTQFYLKSRITQKIIMNSIPHIHCDIRRAGLFAMLGDGVVRAHDHRCYNGSIQQVRDNQYQHELNNFHSDMLHHMSVGPTASHW